MLFSPSSHAKFDTITISVNFCIQKTHFVNLIDHFADKLCQCIQAFTFYQGK